MQPMRLLQILALSIAATDAAGANLSPVTRVVQLLQGLQERVEADHKAEEDLFEKFQCWAKTVIGAKTMSNEKAQSRKDSLEKYIADLDAGRIELTSERVDLEKEIEGLTQDIQEAENRRTAEHTDYLAAKGELDMAVNALTEAIAVLEEAAPQGASSLLMLRAGESLKARAAEGEALSRAIEVGKRFLSKGDGIFLQRLLTGDVPTRDWKKLNRKAEFKQKYEARAGKILKTLKGLLFQFSAGTDDLEHKEEKAASDYTTLHGSKTEQLNKAQDALRKMEVEGAARGLTRSEAETEVTDLTKQMEDDTQYISDTETSLTEKDTQWKARQKVRRDELKAISQAIAILHGDDARDLFKRSFTSQGYLFLQQARERKQKSAFSAARRRDATAVLRMAAHAAGDQRLVALAAHIAAEAPAHFAAVITAIDDMITLLKDEESSDLSTKEDCESTRAKETRDAAVAAREIDDLTDTIDRLKQEITELEAEIQEKHEQIADIEKEIEEALKVRQAEHAEWLKSDKDDEDAAKLIQDATVVLETFYQAQGAALVQKDPLVVEAGEAPPPPPSTWDAPYAGKQEESTGIISILTLVKEDVVADRAKAQTEEDAAAQAHTAFETESNTQIGNLEDSITELEGTKSGKETEESTKTQERFTKKGELDATMERLEKMAPGCDFFTVNFAARSSNRQIEIDGLEKAKAILSGAKFTKPDDSRELKPGDALVQEVHKHS